jgi:hypothetical protein
MKLLREPLVHFLLLGAVLFGVFALLGDRGTVPGLARSWSHPATSSI